MTNPSQSYRKEIRDLTKQLAQAKAETKELDDVLAAWGERARELIASKPTIFDMVFFIVSMGEFLK